MWNRTGKERRYRMKRKSIVVTIQYRTGKERRYRMKRKCIVVKEVT